MENKGSQIPFGLLFEESAPAAHDLAIPIYDEGTDLAYVEDSDGCRTPYVESGLAGTQTCTRILHDIADTDPGEDHQQFCLSRSPLPGTDAFTKAEREPTDQD